MAQAVATRHDSRIVALQVVGALVALMWGAEVVDQVPGVDLDSLGIEPRDPDGLTGVVLAPLLHGGFGHLIGNTIPFVLMGAVIALSGAARLLAVTAIATLVGGLGTWLIAPENTLHIGASGVVFGFAAYLIARGLFSRRLVELAVGVVVVLVWGSTLVAGILLPGGNISWQGHLCGAIGGVIAARVLNSRREPRRAAGALPS